MRRSRPVELHPFRELAGPVHRAVATPSDLLFHIRVQRPEIMDPVDDEAGEAALIGAEDPGSCVTAQKHLDDLRAWNALPVEAPSAATSCSAWSSTTMPSRPTRMSR